MMSLMEKYVIARWCYGIGEDFISDMEYRYIEDKIKEQFPDSEYLTRSWSNDPCPTEILEKYNLGHLIKNISFSHQSESIPSLFTEEEVQREFQGLNEQSRVSYKIDGWNTQIDYYNGKRQSANTRGRSGNFLNANAILEVVPETIPIMGKVKIIGESSIPKDKWLHYKEITGNATQRGSVSTAFANNDSAFLSFLAFDILVEGESLDDKDRYDVLRELGFKSPSFMWVNNYQQLLKAIDILGKRDEKYNYLTDGLVLENSHTQKAIRIGRWEELELVSYVTGYTERRGSYGNSFVVNVHPVMDKGYKRKQVNVTNLDYIIKHNLQIGAPIAFDVRSAANCVLNTERTAELQRQYDGRWEEFRVKIDKQTVI